MTRKGHEDHKMHDMRSADDLEGDATVLSLGSRPVTKIDPSPAFRKNDLQRQTQGTGCTIE